MAAHISQDSSYSQSRPGAPDRVLLASRVLAGIVVPVLAVAFVMLYLFPDNTGLLFAWPVKPRMSAMILGATYLGGAYFFTRVILAQAWHTVRLGFVPVSTFAGILGVATILHWDKFTHNHLSFILWVILYLSLPFIIPVVWYANQKLNAGQNQAPEGRFSTGLRIAIAGMGIVLLVAAAILLVAPQAMIPLWPWTLSPLTARVMAAMFALPGLVGIGVASDGRWSSARTIFEAQAISIGLFLVAMPFARADIHWGQWGIWTFIGGLLLVLGLVAWAAVEAKKDVPPGPGGGSSI